MRVSVFTFSNMDTACSIIIRARLLLVSSQRVVLSVRCDLLLLGV